MILEDENNIKIILFDILFFIHIFVEELIIVSMLR